MKIAITGGIGSGKSTVLSYLKKCGYVTFSCDEIYKELIDKKEYIEAISNIFPTVIIDGKINKEKLSIIVFNDEKKLLELNKIAHPFILKSLFENMDDAENKNEVVFAEVPLLFEGKFENLFDQIWVVYRGLEERISALKQRDGSSCGQILQKIKSQFNYEQNMENLKKIRNIKIIKNERTIKDTEAQIDKLLKS